MANITSIPRTRHFCTQRRSWGSWANFQAPEQDRRFYSYLFGPRFNYEWRKTHLGAWGEFEIGAERTTINGMPIYNKSNFSFGVADGLDFIASRHYVVHLFQIEFASASIRSTHQDDMRLSAGIGFRFGEK